MSDQSRSLINVEMRDILDSAEELVAPNLQFLADTRDVLRIEDREVFLGRLPDEQDSGFGSCGRRTRGRWQGPATLGLVDRPSFPCHVAALPFGESLLILRRMAGVLGVYTPSCDDANSTMPRLNAAHCPNVGVGGHATGQHGFKRLKGCRIMKNP